MAKAPVQVTREATKSEKKKLEKQSKILFACIIGILAVLLAIVLIKTYNDKAQFEYRGITFDKTYFDKILLYTTFDKVEYSINNTDAVLNATFNFRNDPRSLDTLWEKTLGFAGIETERQKQTENISFIKDKKVYLSTVQPMRPCEDNYPAVFGLSSFLTLLAMDVKGAVSDANISQNKTAPVITCENSTNNTVIMLAGGTENKWARTSENCYEITFKKCQVLESVERFQLDVLENYMENNRIGI
jgi:hypothetical protein